MKAAFTLLVLAALCGCGMGAQVDSGRDTSARFLELMALKKYQQAHELCAGETVSLDDLKAWAADPGNLSLLRDFAGVDWSSGGQLATQDGMSTLRLPESTLKGRPDVKVNFTLRKDDDTWKIIGFAIKSGR